MGVGRISLPLLLDALRVEIDAYDKFVDVQGDNYLASLAPGGAPFTAPYGSSLGPKVRTRYEFWPSKRKVWPLLFYCVCQLLAGTKAFVMQQRASAQRFGAHLLQAPGETQG